MSAFIVSCETMNRVVASILPLRSEKLRQVFSSLEPQAIAEALYGLNNLAIWERYGKPEPNPMTRYRFAVTKAYSRFELLKACRCLLYQCAEGSVVKHKLFLFLSEHADDMAMDIVRLTPEYENAAWDAA